jgi:hypothetical protein
LAFFSPPLKLSLPAFPVRGSYDGKRLNQTKYGHLKQFPSWAFEKLPQRKKKTFLSVTAKPARRICPGISVVIDCFIDLSFIFFIRLLSFSSRT